MNVNGNVRTREVFEVVTNSDGIEGRGHDVSLGFFLDRADAVRHAKGKGVMGGSAAVLQRTEQVVHVVHSDYDRFYVMGPIVYANYAQLEAVAKDELRRGALKKLTREERDALGLE